MTGRLSVAVRLGRVSNLPTVWTNVAAGAALAGRIPEAAALALLLLSLSLFYVAGMYLNDAFDRDIDARERPERPIPSGQVTAATVFVAGFTMLAGALLLLPVKSAGTARSDSWEAVAWGFALATAIVVYDMIHKKTSVGVFVMAACRALTYAVAAAAVVTAFALPVAVGMGALFVYVVALTAVAAQENLARLRHAWPLALLAAPPAVALWLGRDEPTGVAFAVLLVGWLVVSLRPLIKSRAHVPQAVARMIAGISLLDAALIGGQGYPLLATAAALATVLTRVLQRSVPGT